MSVPCRSRKLKVGVHRAVAAAVAVCTALLLASPYNGNAAFVPHSGDDAGAVVRGTEHGQDAAVLQRPRDTGVGTGFRNVGPAALSAQRDDVPGAERNASHGLLCRASDGPGRPLRVLFCVWLI